MIGRRWWIRLVVLMLLLPYLGNTAEICFRGQRLHTPFYGPKICLWCESGTFMPDEVHSHEECYPCTTVQKPHLEMLVSPCTSRRDTVIHCIDGYYRTQPSYPEDRGHCQPCTKCPFPKSPCYTYNDAICCPGDDYTVICREDGRVVCARECGPGYFSSSYNDQCVICQENSYMDEEKHVNPYCKICEVPKSQKERIVRSCNATHPTIIDCIEGYSWQFSNIEQTDHGECVKVCGRGQYLNPVMVGTCQKCPENTYMDEEEHGYAYKCKPCALPKSENEKIVRQCDSTHPTVIGCKKGFYRQLSDDLTTSTCFPCRNCFENTDGNVYEGRACGELSNSVCCPQSDMAVVEGRDGPACVFLHNKPTGSPTRGEGEFLYISASGHSAICPPCPQETYMDKVQHTNTACKSCTEFPNKMYCDDSNGSSAPERGLTVNTVIGLMIGQELLLAVILCAVPIVRKKYWWRRWKLRTRGVNDDSETDVPLLERRESDTSRRRSTRFKDSEFGMSISKVTHKEFISVTEFSNVHLPYQYNDNIMTDLVKLQAKLTTLINVKHSSGRRPKCILYTDSPYPHCGNRYKHESHTGSGWVQGVKMYTDIFCPCNTCKLTDTPQKKWGEVVICTATRVVFDITEGENCQCYFFYENDDTDLLTCPSLSGPVNVLSDVDRDWCYMTFVTHNLELVQELHDHFTRYHRLRRDVQHKYQVVNDDTTYEDLTDKLPSLHSRFEHSLNLLEKEIEEIERKPEDYRKTGPVDVVTTYGYWIHEKPNSFRRAFVDITTGDQQDATDKQRLITMLSSLHKTYNHCLEEITVLKRQLEQNNVEDVLVDKYRELRGRESEFNRFLRPLMLNLRECRGDTLHTDFPRYQARYNSDHALTIIVSHPKGRSQQVSLGEVTDIKSLRHDHHSIYRYTNKTWQGCEGARVFILGNRGTSDHSHSGNIGQEGESGAWSDVIPYIVNLSALPLKN